MRRLADHMASACSSDRRVAAARGRVGVAQLPDSLAGLPLCLQTQLVKRGVLRQEEFKAREGRKAAARKADIEAREANKKKRAPQFRKVTNTHLGIPMS